MAALLNTERRAIANASLATRIAGYRHTLPKDREEPLETPPGMREAWAANQPYKRPTPKYPAHRPPPHRCHYDKMARRAARRQPNPVEEEEQEPECPTEDQPRE